MASTVRMISLAAALIATAVLFTTTPQAQAWAAAEVEKDMVPVSPAVSVMVAIPGGGAGTLAAPICLQCHCCSKSNPRNCQVTSCCSTFNCNPAGKCNLVQLNCGCSNC